MFSNWHPAWRYLGGSAFVLLLLVLLLAGPEIIGKDQSPPLVIFCAAGLREPVTMIAGDYEAATGQGVDLRFDGSESLLNSLLLGAPCDIYFPADDSYIALARQRGIHIDEVVTIASQRAVLVTASGNPKNIQSWNDLFDKKATIAQAQPDAAAIGRLTKEYLSRSGRWGQLDRHTLVYLGTVTDVVNAVSLATADAGIVWDVLAVNHSKLHVVRTSELNDVKARVQAGIVRRSGQTEQARKFLQYAGAADGGLRRFRESGFEIDEAR